MQVALNYTPLTMGEVKRIARLAYKRKFGRAMGKAEPYLLAMLALENAKGNGIFNHNWGNVTVWKPSKEDYWLHTTPSGKQYKFKSFSSHKAGVDHWLKTLTSQTHQRILDAARADDFDSFFKSIITPHPITKKVYCDTCDSAAHRKSYATFVDQFKREAGQPSRRRRTRKRKDVRGPFVLFTVTALVGAVIASQKRDVIKRQLRKFKDG